MSDHNHSIYHGHDHGSHNHSIFSPDVGQPLYRQEYGTINVSGVLNKQLEAAIADMKVNLSKQIFSENILLDRINQQAKELNMSTIDKITNERREKREREELEAKFEGWDAALGSAADGDIYGFSWTPPNGKTYRYAALFVDKRWYLTGQTPGGFHTEDFIAWLIEKDVQIGDVVFMEPIG